MVSRMLDLNDNQDIQKRNSTTPMPVYLSEETNAVCKRRTKTGQESEVERRVALLD